MDADGTPDLNHKDTKDTKTHENQRKNLRKRVNAPIRDPSQALRNPGPTFLQFQTFLPVSLCSLSLRGLVRPESASIGVHRQFHLRPCSLCVLCVSAVRFIG